jgi:fumarylacetoacetase
VVAALSSWPPVEPGSPFPIANLPYAVSTDGIVVAVGDHALVAGAAAEALGSPHAGLLGQATLADLLAAGPQTWAAVRHDLTRWLSDPALRPSVEPHLVPRDGVPLSLPLAIGDYVDFYASEHHARRLGAMLRPGGEALLPNWRHLPVGYHGRSGTVVVSGTAVRRPWGQWRDADGKIVFAPTRRLDLEVEVGFVVGVPSTLGQPVPVDEFERHVFGICLVNDWSARDIQAWEAQPLGPFLGKSFATSVSPWVVPLAALMQARVPVGSSGGDELLPYLREREPWGLDLALELRVNGEVLARPAYRSMHWSPAQMLAHMTANGALVRTGDLFASGTVSGPELDEAGSLIERFGGDRYLADGDEVVISALAPGPGGTTIGLGEVRGVVAAAVEHPGHARAEDHHQSKSP